MQKQKDLQLLVVTEDSTLKIGPVPKSYYDDYNSRAQVCGTVNCLSNIACSPDGFLYCVKNGNLYTGPMPKDKGDWFTGSTRVGGHGWGEIRVLFFHPNGDLYATTQNGDLYKGPKPEHNDGFWRDRVATKIGSGDWNKCGALCFHPDGTLYAVWGDDTLVKGKPPTAPGNWLASTIKVGSHGWLKLTHFMAFSPDGQLWCVDRFDGKLFKRSPPTHEHDDFVSSAQNLGFNYNMYDFLFFI
ncbi:uncharacterized protein LOC142303960 [Anomaloglossus baeobatrachus]|uniref:uncharacterized protein LOC142303960 n=1 Tax=Anomaloglossus baeobatrachus TaxID=238106 RepID=UPI003F503359